MITWRSSINAEDLKTSWNWWRNLSINQMKAVAKKHYPNCYTLSQRMIWEMWTDEGKPLPQELIPVTV